MKNIYHLILLTVFFLPPYGFEAKKYAYKAAGKARTVLGVLTLPAASFLPFLRATALKKESILFSFLIFIQVIYSIIYFILGRMVF